MSLSIQSIQRVSQNKLVQRPYPAAKRVANNSVTFGAYSKHQVFGAVIALNIGITVIKTLVHGKAYEHEGFSEKDRRLLFVQEAVRQSVSTGLWLGSLCASMAITKRAFPKLSPMNYALVSNLISTMPDAFVRPFLTAKLSKHFLGIHSQSTSA